MYMKLAKEAELERQSKHNKKASKKRSKSGKHHRHAVADEDDDQDEDIPAAHVVSTAVDLPEVCAFGFKLYYKMFSNEFNA
jgi:hypothetical protein